MTRVTLILVDGLRPDAITPEHAPILHSLLAGSRRTLEARSVLPSLTLPCHHSILYSLPPQLHGVVENTPPAAPPGRGLFEHLAAHRKACAFLYGWGTLRCLAQPGSLRFEWAYDLAERDLDSDARLLQTAIEVLPAGRFDFSFVYLGTLDTAGHLYTWMSEGYLKQLRKLDALLAPLIEALADHALILLSDHGGHDRLHGTDLPEDMTIPFAIRAPGLDPGLMAGPASLLDLAPTVCGLLGLPPASGWQGRSLLP